VRGATVALRGRLGHRAAGRPQPPRRAAGRTAHVARPHRRCATGPAARPGPPRGPAGRRPQRRGVHGPGGGARARRLRGAAPARRLGPPARDGRPGRRARHVGHRGPQGRRPPGGPVCARPPRAPPAARGLRPGAPGPRL
ncbi:MAG: hypothetical protein AVDCRST_MAG79-3068, partial [uncultured Thermoleophilia bacterium]